MVFLSTSSGNSCAMCMHCRRTRLFLYIKPEHQFGVTLNVSEMSNSLPVLTDIELADES